MVPPKQPASRLANLRFMLDYIHANVDKQSSATNSTQVGAKMDAIALRTQFAF